MKPLHEFLHDVRQRVPGYRRFLEEQGMGPDAPVAFGDLPLQTKQNYLLKQDIADLCWDGSVRGCHIIGASSGFSKSGSVFWPKRPEDEKEYVHGLEQMFVGHYGVDKKRTLIFCCMALGTWFGGMAITAGLRVLCTEGRLPITVCTPGLNLGEAVEIYARFHRDYDQFLWITNPSSIGLIRALLKQRTLDVKPGTMFFPVVGEYYSEAFRESVAAQYGHGDEPFVVWTGYGSADAGDLGVETADTIRLRKFFHRHEGPRRAFFGGDDTPMLLAPTNKKHLEIVDGRIVVTADLLVPLVRYDTGDEGGFVEKAALTTAAQAEGWPLDTALLDRLPERVLYVRGRVSDQVIFYGTNLNVQDINTRFLALPPDWHYSGLFTVRPVDQGGIGIFEFTVFVDGAATAELAEKYKTVLVEFLQSQSLEFRAKYTNLTQSVGTELIRVQLERLQAGQGQIKHRYVVKG